MTTFTAVRLDSEDKPTITNTKTTLTEQLTCLQQAEFTGRLNIQSNTGRIWRLYFCMSKLLWAEGGVHPDRSWKRHLLQYCPQVEPKNITIRQANQFECQNYYMLTVLLKRDIITQAQLTALVKSKIAVALFDIQQEETTEKLNYSLEVLSADFLFASGLKMSLAIVTIEQALKMSTDAWSAWCKKGLGRLSPNLAPGLRHHDKLQEQISQNVYQNLVKLIDGQLTLRDLAVKMNKDLLQLTCGLMAFMNKGFLELTAISDLSPSTTRVKPAVASSSPQKLSIARKPLIVSIDDSMQMCKTMEQIIKGAGYRFISINNPLQAFSKLIQSNPDLIFLDIEMPIINGYEICAQLRRVSKLKDTPIIILTGNDRVVDRMRAKVVGASDFLPKSINVQTITNIVEKYLPFAQDKTNIIAGAKQAS